MSYLPSNFHCWVFSLNSTNGEKLEGTAVRNGSHTEVPQVRENAKLRITDSPGL